MNAALYEAEACLEQALAGQPVNDETISEALPKAIELLAEKRHGVKASFGTGEPKGAIVEAGKLVGAVALMALGVDADAAVRAKVAAILGADPEKLEQAIRSKPSQN